MSEKKIDMFKLVEEVEKRKAADIDQIFNDLDSIKKEEPQNVSSTNASYKTSTVTLIKKPGIPADNEIGAYVTRFEAFRGIVEHVSYGSNGNNEYIEGHRDALKKYYEDAYNNFKDLYVIEARVNDELNRYTSKQYLYEKGYYDGMNYIMRALKHSKELLMKTLDKQIREKL